MAYRGADRAGDGRCQSGWRDCNIYCEGMRARIDQRKGVLGRSVAVVRVDERACGRVVARYRSMLWKNYVWIANGIETNWIAQRADVDIKRPTGSHWACRRRRMGIGEIEGSTCRVGRARGCQR